MGDEERALEPVSRSARPALWIGGWLVVLAAVIGFAILAPTRQWQPIDAPSFEAAVVSASPTASATPLRVQRPLPSRPPIGEDGLMGGIVFGTNWPPD